MAQAIPAVDTATGAFLGRVHDYLDGRYVRLDSLPEDRIFLEPAAFSLLNGTAALGSIAPGTGSARRTAFTIPASDNRIGTTAMLPSDWEQFDIDLWWTSPTTATGTVAMEAFTAFVDDGELLGSGVSTSGSAPAAPTQYVMKRTTLTHAPISATANVPLTLQFHRGTSGTLAADMSMLGIELRRV